MYTVISMILCIQNKPLTIMWWLYLIALNFFTLSSCLLCFWSYIFEYYYYSLIHCLKSFFSKRIKATFQISFLEYRQQLTSMEKNWLPKLNFHWHSHSYKGFWMCLAMKHFFAKQIDTASRQLRGKEDRVSYM